MDSRSKTRTDKISDQDIRRTLERGASKTQAEAGEGKEETEVDRITEITTVEQFKTPVSQQGSSINKLTLLNISQISTFY